MKKEFEIYEEYVKYNHYRPLLFGKRAHWKAYLHGYEMGHKDAVDECYNEVKEKPKVLEEFRKK